MSRVFLFLAVVAAAFVCGVSGTTSNTFATDLSSFTEPHASHAVRVFATLDTKAYIQEHYKSSNQVKVVRNAIPRWGKTDKFDVQDSEYQMSVVYTVAPGAALLIVTLLMWIIWGIVCCCCCRPDGKTGEAPPRFTKNQIRIPLITATICALVVIAFAIVGLWATEEFHKQISGNKGVGQNTLNILDHVNGFFGKMNKNLLTVSNSTAYLAPSVDARLSTFTDLGNGLPGVLDALRTYQRNVAAIDPVTVQQVDPETPPGTTATYSCSSCADLSSTTSDFINGLDKSATPVFDQVDETKKAARDQVADAVPDIQEGIASASDQVNEINDQATKYQKDVRDFKDQADDYEKIRRAVVLVIWLIPIFCCLLFFIFTLAFRKESCTKLLVHIMFFSGILIWIIFLVHLPFSLLVADSCHYLDLTDPDLTGQTSLSTKITIPLTACLAQNNILDALEVTSELNFTNTVVFPVVPDVAQLLNASALNNLNNEVQGLDLSTFPSYDPQQKFALLDTLNTETNTSPRFDYFTFANASTCVPANYGTRASVVHQARSAVLTALKAEQTLTNTLQDMKVNMTRIVAQYDALTNKTKQLLYVDMAGLKDVIQPLLNDAQNVLDQAFCNPLDQDYKDMKSLFCTDMIVSVSSMAMASFFVGIFMFFVNFSCWFLIYRLEHGDDKPVTLDGSVYGVASPSGSGDKIYNGVLVSEGSIIAPQPTSEMVPLESPSPNAVSGTAVVVHTE